MYAVYYHWSTHTSSLMQLKLLATRSFLNAPSFVSRYPPGNALPVAVIVLCRRRGLGESQAGTTSVASGGCGTSVVDEMDFFFFLTSRWLPIVGSPQAFSMRFQPECSQKIPRTKPWLGLELCGVSERIWCYFMLHFKWPDFQIVFRAGAPARCVLL